MKIYTLAGDEEAYLSASPRSIFSALFSSNSRSISAFLNLTAWGIYTCEYGQSLRSVVRGILAYLCKCLQILVLHTAQLILGWDVP